MKAVQWMESMVGRISGKGKVDFEFRVKKSRSNGGCSSDDGRDEQCC